MLKLSLKKVTRLSIILIMLIGLGVQVKPAAAVDPLTIIVNLMSDEPDLYAWDGFCDTTEGGAYDCTLRAAIQHANYLQSENGTLIKFAIEHGDNPILGARIPISQTLPSLQAPGTVIQGPNITGKPIVLDGQGGAYPGLEILANNCEIKNLTISHFGGYGIVVGNSSTPVTGTKITGNLIGDFNLFTSDSDPNYGGIRLLNAVSSLIGSSIPAEGNVISGNTWEGILIDLGGSNVIKGNHIGLTEDGTAALPNHTGIFIDGSNGNTIGGGAAGERSIISGNSSSGVNVQGSNNIIQGNYIGTDVSGTLAIPNGASGIKVGNPVIICTRNQIGGAAAGQGNLISGNLDAGIRLYDSESTEIFGNTIGLDASRTGAIPNQFGITLNNCTNTVIGGPENGKDNVISGNTRQGIFVGGSETQNTSIKHNYIGVNNYGTSFPNGEDGISVQYASGTTIGGGDEPNTIANNADNGIKIEYAAAKIAENYIFNNASLGIDVIAKDGQAGVTRNDFSEADDVQNFPGLTNVSLLGSGTVLLEGQMTTSPGELLTIYFYGNDSCDSSGYGEGKLPLGFLESTADASGKISFSKILTFTEPIMYFTATAWGPKFGNSEFSPCRGEGTYPPIMLDVYLPLIMK